MADADVDDDEVFSWSGSCREYVKVTKELLAWSVPISERMKELVTPRWLNRFHLLVLTILRQLLFQSGNTLLKRMYRGVS